jgi:hypothetical protein
MESVDTVVGDSGPDAIRAKRGRQRGERGGLLSMICNPQARAMGRSGDWTGAVLLPQPRRSSVMTCKAPFTLRPSVGLEALPGVTCIATVVPVEEP